MRWRDFDHLTPLPDTFFDQARRVHFVGIGGIGMSALAFALRARGHAVSGSDAGDSAMLAKLREAGITTMIGHSAANLQLLDVPAQAVIFGSAIAPDNPEMQAARDLSVPQWHRAQLLAYFVNKARFSIAVSGTHGKSTTSAMIAHILAACGKNPTALLGAVYPPFGSNVRLGDPDLVVAEADESDGSFTLLKPSVAVVTNVEPEHLENYDDSEDELWRAFGMFVEGARGEIILNADDVESRERLDTEQWALTYGLHRGHLGAHNISAREGKTYFDLKHGNNNIGTFSLGAAGRHNLSNALAAICAAFLQQTSSGSETYNQQVHNQQVHNQDFGKAAATLADFHGIARRFEFKGQAGGVLLYDDYAHHPTEVKTTLETARDFLKRPILLIFQPHRYSRTQQMGHDFGPAFEVADRVIVTQLYSAFEEPIEGVSGRIVFDSLRQHFPAKAARYAENLDEAQVLALEMARPGDVIITMGAGDVNSLAPRLLRALQEAQDKERHDQHA